MTTCFSNGGLLEMFLYTYMKYGINTKPTPKRKIKMKLAILIITIIVFSEMLLSSSLGVFEFK